MVSSISLGSFYTSSSGQLLLGGAGGSGLDTKSLMESLITAKKAPATRDQVEIDSNNSKNSALTTFNSLLSNFQSSLDALRNPVGVDNAASDAFRFTTTSIGNGGSSYFSASSSPGAALQTYRISDISSVASTANQTSGIFELDSADEDATVGPGTKFNAGTITFKGATITIDEGDSLNKIAATFNAVKSTTGVSVSVIKIDDTHFELSFVADNTGTNGNFNVSTATGDTNVYADLGLSAATAGTNAIFKFNGIEITRQSNSIGDVVSGVTLTILQETPDDTTNYNLLVKPDIATVQASIASFITNFNALKTFGAEQTKINADGTYDAKAVLAYDETFRQIIAEVEATVIGQVTGVAEGALGNLSDLGISFTKQNATDTTPEVSNVLTVDPGKLSSLLETSFQQVRAVFGFTYTANDANFSVFSHTNNLSVDQITLEIDPDEDPPVFTATFNPGGGNVTVNLTATSLGEDLGYTLEGPAGSAIEGLKMIYASETPKTIVLKMARGIADQMYNVADTATKTNTGTLAIAQKSIKTKNETLTQDIERVNVLVEQYRQILLKQFAALEAAISRSNTLLQSLTANQNAALIAAQS